MVHRLIWVMHYGQIPPDLYVDHIDRDKKNNRIENLRLVTHAQNQRNKSFSVKSNTGKLGVSKVLNRYCASITINGRTKKIGSFKTLKEAVAARAIAEQCYY